MKSACLTFSVIAFNAEQFHAAKQCRNIVDKSQQDQIAREMIASLDKLLQQEERIDRYVDYYAEYPILAITYSREIVKLSLTEQRRMLQTFIGQSDQQATKDRYDDICTAYINMKSSLFFPECWPHPHHNLPRMIAFSEEYFAFLSSNKNGMIRQTKILEQAPSTFVNDKLFWELTGIRAAHSLDNHVCRVTPELAERMLAEIKTLAVKKTIENEHALFISFLTGVLNESVILLFEYAD